jgi:branched-chain amino acid aminotransferase group I
MQIISFDKRDGYIWFNGQFVPWPEAKIHVMTHGLNYASCVFEGERVYKGVIFKSHQHTQRLEKSANLLGFKLPFTAAEINKAKDELVKKQNIENGYMKMMAWRGSEQMTIAAPQSSIHMMIALWSLPSYYRKEVVEKGLSLMISEWVRPPASSMPTDSKAACGYVINTLSKHAAADKGFDDALMLDYRGLIAEGTSANFFMVIDGELHTPIPDCFLNGITRQTVIDLAKKRNIKVIERHIELSELSKANEAFLTGTASEIVPIKSINDYSFSFGPVTKVLVDDYHELVNNWRN